MKILFALVVWTSMQSNNNSAVKVGEYESYKACKEQAYQVYKNLQTDEGHWNTVALCIPINKTG